MVDLEGALDSGLKCGLESFSKCSLEGGLLNDSEFALGSGRMVWKRESGKGSGRPGRSSGKQGKPKTKKKKKSYMILGLLLCFGFLVLPLLLNNFHLLDKIHKNFHQIHVHMLMDQF